MLVVWYANSDGSYSKPTLYMNNKMASQKASELIDYFFLLVNFFLYKYLFMYVFIGEQAKRARHSQVCSIENRGYIIYIYYGTCKICSYNP